MKSTDITALLKALSNENRVEIVKLIAKSPGITANRLLKTLHVAQSTLSHHMHILVEAGVVIAIHEGKWSHYTVSSEALDSLDRFINGLRADRSQRARRLRMLMDLKNDPKLPARQRADIDRIIDTLTS